MNRRIKHIVSVLASVLLLTACELTEDPKFLASENLFADEVGANIVLNGVYSSVADFGYYGSEYHHALNYTSGLYNSNKNSVLLDVAALNPTPITKEISNFWNAAFQAISRANNLIVSFEEVEIENTVEKDNIMGQAYFIRSLTYFNIIRAFGKCPLLVESATAEDPHMPMADPQEVYDQIIVDAQLAEQLLPEIGDNAAGRPTKYAASMLLAKVYMQLAGNKTAGETGYWKNAYDEAIKAYGKYSLVQDFSSLWDLKTSNNTVESIFEIQHNVEYRSRLIYYWTASNVTASGNNWARFKPNLEVYDRHVARYPEDPRIQYTFVTDYQKWNKGELTDVATYPTFTKRGNKEKSYPYGYKYFAKDNNMTSTDTDLNFVVFRYADLLLMLAEIENELNGPDNAYQYVNEVLARARVAGGANAAMPADWSGMTQDEFRENITFEYLFELLEEGHDWFNVRRRGYDFFKKNVLEAHDNHPDYDFSNNLDPEYTISDRIMLLPIPNDEISSNLKLTNDDQNPGY